MFISGYAQPAANPAPRFGGQANNDAPTNIIPIVAINPYQNRWTIKARVVSKSAIRTWSNPRGEGKLFSMDLLDESASIRATAFTDVCDKFHDMMEVNNLFGLDFEYPNEVYDRVYFYVSAEQSVLHFSCSS